MIRHAIRRVLTAAAVLAALASATTVAPSAARAAETRAIPRHSWPQYQGDAGHSGWARGETGINASNVGQLQLAWSTFSESFVPVEAHGLLFHIPNVPTTLDANDAMTGTQRWRSGNGLSGLASVSGSTLYVAQPNTLLALSTATGALRWSTPVEQEIDAPPVIGAGLVFEVSSGLTTIYALDARTGAVRWSLPFSDASTQIPAVAGGRLFVTGFAKLYALDAATGTIDWSVSTAKPSLPDPVVLRDAVYVIVDGAVMAFAASTGAPLWHTGDIGATSLAVNRHRVAVLSGPTGTVTALDAATGHEQWHTTVDGSTFERPPILGGGLVFAVDSAGHLAVLRADTGRSIQVIVNVGGRGSLAIVDGTLFVETGGTLSAFRVKGG